MDFNIFRRKANKEKREKIEPTFEPVRVHRFAAAESDDFLSGWTTGDYETINSRLMNCLETLRARSRQASRDNPYAKRFLDLAQRNIVGDGFVCRPKTGDKGLDRALLKALARQSRAANFTTQGNMTRAQFECLAVAALFRDGEFLAQKVISRDGTGFSIRPLDASQLATYERTVKAANGNRIIMGVECNKDYKAVAYHFHTGNPKSQYANIFTYNVGETTRIPASQIIHLFVPQYANQVRGIPHFHAALRQMKTQKEYDETEQQAARKSSAMIMTLKTKDGNAPLTGAKTPTGERVADLSGKTLLTLSDSESLDTHTAGSPNPNYPNFTDKVNQRIATGLDTSAPLLTQNFGNANFSSSQLMYYDDRDNWRKYQRFVSETLHSWWFDEWLRVAILRGDIVRDNGEVVTADMYEALSMPEWIGKQFPPVDPVKASKANETLLKMGVKTRAKIIREMGGDPDEELAEYEEERDRFGDYGAKPESESPPPKPDDGTDDEEDGDNAEE